MKTFFLQVIFLIIFNISFGESFNFMTQDVVDKYFNAEQICLQLYTTRIGSITQEIKADSISCLKAADIRFQSNIKFEILKEPMTKCSSPESGINDYFKCIENIAPETREKFKEITTDNELFLQNINQIEQNKTTCLRKASRKGKYKSTYAVLYLSQCLQAIHQPQMDSSKEQILVEKPPPPPEEEKSFWNKLGVIRQKYDDMKLCTLNGKSYNFCFSNYNLDRFQHDSDKFNYDDDGQRSKKNYLVDFLAVNFLEIIEIDKANGSCLRQYIMMNINWSFKFDLQSCLLFGSRLSLESEEDYEKYSKLIDDLIEAYKEFSKCRDITEDLDTSNCVHKKFESSLIREIKDTVSIKPETNFKDFKEILLSSYTDQYPCIENLYDFLQFDDYNMRPMEKNVLYSCLEKGYKPTAASLPFEEQLAKDLSEIQEYLKTCTEHPKSPGYDRCFRNIIKVYDSTRQNLPYKTSKYSLKHDVLASQILLRTIL